VFTFDDTIVAVSTPPGQGAIGIVRWSGPEALRILRAVFRPASPSLPGLAGWKPQSHLLTYGHAVDPQTGVPVDEVLAVWMQAPRTYTRQDVAEMHCHGGVVAVQHILSMALAQGARLAQPGEFTLRAFLNGRIDLAQAEAVLDIVQAKTEIALHMAVNQLAGGLSGPVRQIRQELVKTVAFLEASLDFPEDEIPPLNVASALQASIHTIQTLLSQAKGGLVYRQGIRTAIIGRPNVGKSSLLNALLRVDRAIVSPVPGTTRDTVEETLNLRGIPLCLVDTAGLTPTSDSVELLGIERTQIALKQADLVLMVLDSSQALHPDDEDLADSIRQRPAIVVINKSDLPLKLHDSSVLPQAPHVYVSALTGFGIADLEQAVVDTVLSGQVVSPDTLVTANPRHIEILTRACGHVQDAAASLQQPAALDITAVDVTAAITALGEITGETIGEDVLDAIFRSFCVGK
jgi:tRNA modification GTPase